MGTKRYTKEEIGEKVREEEVKVDTIRNFLRANAGFSYSADAIAKETGIKCVDNLLYFRWEDYAKAVGIERKALIAEDTLGCSTVLFYHVNEKLSRRIWKRK
jgi:hypothetical protein